MNAQKSRIAGLKEGINENYVFFCFIAKLANEGSGES